MDWNAFVDLVSPTRLAVLGIALAITVALGLLGAIKAGQFKWTQVATVLAPGLNFFYLTLGYVATAAIAAWVDPDWEPAVITAYTFILVAMVAKIKEQITYLAPGLPIINWKLPLETKAE
jgi:predicted Na+-dependent transporter